MIGLTGASPGSSDLQLPDLRIVPTSSLLLHEECDPVRTGRLAQSMRADGILRNPPIVAPVDRVDYVVLDGANRVTALGLSGAPHQLVQVVDYDDPALRLDVWAHLLLDDGLRLLREGPGDLGWKPLSEEALDRGLALGDLACGLVTAEGALGLASPGSLAEKIEMVVRVVATYRGRTAIYRVPPGGMGVLLDTYERAAALVRFPEFSKDDIRAASQLPSKLPTGISRHLIPQRALRVNIDLAVLRSEESLEVKQARLEELVRARLRDNRVRRYPEATVLYDE